MYLDNAATTKPSETVIEAVKRAMVFDWYNPSSSNANSRQVKKIIEEVRHKCAESIGAEDDEIFFTSGGSEGNNMILKGLHGGLFPIVISKVEHESIMRATSNWLSRYTVPVDKHGRVIEKKLDEILENTNAKLLSVMAINNETGALNDLWKLSHKAHKHGMFFHTDAVQAYGYIDINVKSLEIDAMTVSGHKINAPKGIGFVYISRDMQRFMSHIIDGSQENGFRGGTENTYGIVGLGAALDSLAVKRVSAPSMKEIKVDMKEQIKKRIPNAKFNDSEIGHPGLLSITLPGIDGEALQMALELKTIIVSGRSACSSKSKEPSHVLKAIGLTDDEASSTIRVSFDWDFTKTEANIFVDILCECVKRLGGNVKS